MQFSEIYYQFFFINSYFANKNIFSTFCAPPPQKKQITTNYSVEYFHFQVNPQLNFNKKILPWFLTAYSNILNNLVCFQLFDKLDYFEQVLDHLIVLLSRLKDMFLGLNQKTTCRLMYLLIDPLSVLDQFLFHRSKNIKLELSLPKKK